MNITDPGLKFSILLGFNYISSGLYLQTSLAWVTLYRRFLSPASTASQVMEAHKRFHHGKVNCLWKWCLTCSCIFVMNC